MGPLVERPLSMAPRNLQDFHFQHVAFLRRLFKVWPVNFLRRSNSHVLNTQSLYAVSGFIPTTPNPFSALHIKITAAQISSLHDSETIDLPTLIVMLCDSFCPVTAEVFL
jgi:uncharacterized membrane protein